MDLGFLMQRQAAIPIVGRSFLLLRGILLCIFVPGKTLFFNIKLGRTDDMKQGLSILLAGLMLLCLCGCAAGDSGAALQDAVSAKEAGVAHAGRSVSKTSEEHAVSPGEHESTVNESEQPKNSEEEPTMDQNTFYVTISDQTFAAALADNPGAEAFKALLADGPLTIEVSDYGGFEKVGPLEQRLPTENAQTTTQAGDIVLYQGDQIVLFYGSNSWSYTRLGKIDDLTGWAEALGGGDLFVTFSLQKP